MHLFRTIELKSSMISETEVIMGCAVSMSTSYEQIKTGFTTNS